MLHTVQVNWKHDPCWKVQITRDHIIYDSELENLWGLEADHQCLCRPGAVGRHGCYHGSDSNKYGVSLGGHGNILESGDDSSSF